MISEDYCCVCDDTLGRAVSMTKKTEVLAERHKRPHVMHIQQDQDAVSNKHTRSQHATNRIIANVRPSSNRTQAMWDDVCNALTKAWNDIVVNTSSPPNNKSIALSSPPSNRKNSFLSNSPPDFKDLGISNNNSKKSSPEDTQLRGIFILGTIIAGQEVGVSLPAAGEDRAWMRENMEKFKRLAKEGDKEIKEMLEEIEQRGLMKEE